LLACLNRAVKNFGSTAPSLASASLRFFRIGVTKPPPPSCPYFSRSSEPAAHGSASLKASPTACPASPNSRPATIPTASSTVTRSLYSFTRSRQLHPHLSASPLTPPRYSPAAPPHGSAAAFVHRLRKPFSLQTFRPAPTAARSASSVSWTRSAPSSAHSPRSGCCSSPGTRITKYFCTR